MCWCWTFAKSKRHHLNLDYFLFHTFCVISFIHFGFRYKTINQKGKTHRPNISVVCSVCSTFFSDRVRRFFLSIFLYVCIYVQMGLVLIQCILFPLKCLRSFRFTHSYNRNSALLCIMDVWMCECVMCAYVRSLFFLFNSLARKQNMDFSEKRHVSKQHFVVCCVRIVVRQFRN